MVDHPYDRSMKLTGAEGRSIRTSHSWDTGKESRDRECVLNRGRAEANRCSRKCVSLHARCAYGWTCVAGLDCSTGHIHTHRRNKRARMVVTKFIYKGGEVPWAGTTHATATLSSLAG